MNDKNMNIERKDVQLEIDRREITIDTYFIIIIIGTLGGFLSVILNDIYTDSQKIIYLGLVLLLCAINSGILLYCKKSSNKTLVDNLLLLIVVIVYMTILGISSYYKVIAIAVWLPVIVFLLFSSLDKKRLFVFLGMHILVMIYFSIKYPQYTVIIDRGNYTSLIINAFLLFIISAQMIKLFKTYQDSIFKDYEEIHGQNIKLAEINEELNMTKETLVAKYEEVKKANFASERLRESQQIIIDVSEDVINVYDLDDKKFMHLTKFEEFFIMDCAKFKNNPIEALKSILIDSDKEIIEKKWKQLINKTVTKVKLELELKEEQFDTKYFQFVAKYYKSKLDDTGHVAFAFKDITVEKKQANKIYKQAYYDELTELLNRNGFRDKLSNLDNEDVYVIYLDIVRFKDVNSVYGYEIGDVMLKQVAIFIDELPYDIILSARVASDVFAIVVSTDVDLEKLLKELKTFEKSKMYKEFYINLNFNMGIFKYEELKLSTHEIMKAADMALIKAKDMAYQSSYIYGESLNDEVERRVIMLHELEKAMKKEELFMVYQPIVDSITKETTSFEALVRWDSKEFGMVSPLEFIILAEKSSLIEALGFYIVDKICQFIAHDKILETDYRISINISGKQLFKDDFAQKFINIVDEYRIPHEKIGVEVTETGLIDNLKLATKHLKYLRECGFKIYLDDFGTGYSSLNYLDQLPIDVLKIDRAFIIEIVSNSKKQRLLKAIVLLAKELNIMTVAEGVETAEQYEMLKELSIDLIQGYYFSKPIKGEEILEKL